MKQYFELEIPLKGFDSDCLSGIVHLAGCLGIQELNDQQWMIYLPGEWSAEQCKDFLKQLQEINPDFQPEKVRCEKRPFQAWHSEWRKHFQPFEAIKNIWIRPPWQKLLPEIKGEEIIIDPQMAFGTGHHESTRLMMQSIQKTPLKDTTVLDLGTGSGILAMMARKHAAKKVLAIDVDPDAIANARHNLKLNQLDGIDYQVGDLSLAEGKTFAVILANIHFEVLASLALQLYGTLKNPGKLIISGILKQDISRISYLYKQAGFIFYDKLSLKEWAAIIWEKK